MNRGIDMSKADNFSDEKILIDAIEIQKTTSAEYLNVINNCVEESVVNEFELILSEQLETLKKLKAEAVKRNLINNVILPQADVKKVAEKYS